MKRSSFPRHGCAAFATNQRGLVLFFALIALVAMSLAALALVRSVDTATLISGNLAFRQAATSSGDAGVEAAIATLDAMDLANADPSAFKLANHVFNVASATNGYYPNADPDLNLTSDATWTNDTSSDAVVDTSGNSYRYIIQRMCRTANAIIPDASCLFSAAATDTSGKSVPLPSQICEGSGCPKGGQSPLYRVTVRVTGPRNTVSYVQTMVH